ncbi:hypothetical protein PCANC_18983 [Puccinia coronata f. sp. avenae]|uniref:Uncharacterized protein n=1 Tax=Puccinia coronata f. sp. avenae TaxID=200324 RepID=A0A2N5U3F6_9BASI|nr:hypothetical protein PCANC_18983 [Puccinia coronata f. sp. avenae]
MGGVDSAGNQSSQFSSGLSRPRTDRLRGKAQSPLPARVIISVFAHHEDPQDELHWANDGRSNPSLPEGKLTSGYLVGLRIDSTGLLIKFFAQY